MVFFSLILIFQNIIVAYSQDEVLMKEKQLLLESLGSSGSSNLFLSYLSLSLIEREVQLSEDTSGLDEILQSIIKLCEIAKDNFSDIKKNIILSQQDVDFINSIDYAYSLVKEDAILLKNYINTLAESDQKLFKVKHKQAGDYLNDMFKE